MIIETGDPRCKQHNFNGTQDQGDMLLLCTWCGEMRRFPMDRPVKDKSPTKGT